ncbi:MAG TPA: hypothetical protein VFI65_21980 [Streptosporangiaceae bacterium]|nr:hypothetical protein [Streptosporangiaceae bacterium]
MRKHQAQVLAVLARARPARLNADAAPRVSWPTVAKLMETAELADDGPVSDADPGERWPLVRRRPLVPVKLVGAMTSAAVTAVVIVVAVFVGSVVLRAPHHQPTAAPSPGQPSAGRLAFRSLPLGPRWHGHLAYAVNYGMVYLTGNATLDHRGSQSGKDGPMTTLPPSARPAGQLSVVATVSAGAGSLKIGADGQVDVISQQVGVTWVSLDGVSFPVGSG